MKIGSPFLLQAKIVQEFQSNFDILTDLWQEIGFEVHECRSAGAEILSEIKRVLRNKVTCTQDIKSGLNSQIRLCSARYKCSFYFA